jgi:hypothetical protein
MAQSHGVRRVSCALSAAASLLSPVRYTVPCAPFPAEAGDGATVTWVMAGAGEGDGEGAVPDGAVPPPEGGATTVGGGVVAVPTRSSTILG